MSFFLLSYQEIRPCKIWWKEIRQSTYWDLIERVVWHMSLEMRFFFLLNNILYDIWNINVFGERVETFCQTYHVCKSTIKM
jgi:hypothetical protein